MTKSVFYWLAEVTGIMSRVPRLKGEDVYVLGTKLGRIVDINIFPESMRYTIELCMHPDEAAKLIEPIKKYFVVHKTIEFYVNETGDENG